MKKIISIFILVMVISPVFSQTEKLLNPADLKQQTIITEPLSLRKGYLRIGLFYSYAAADKYFNDSGKKIYFPESTWGSSSGLQFWAQYGVSDRFMVELGIPYTSDLTNIHFRYLFPEFDTMRIYNASNRSRGIGDIIASATYQIIPSGENKFSLKASLDLTLPTGKKNPTNVVSEDEYDGPTGYGVFCLMPKITARMLSYPFSFLAYLSYNYNFKGSRLIYPTDPEETKFKYGNSLTAGGSINIHLNEWIALVNEINYYHAGKGEIDGVPKSDLNTTWALSYEPRVVFQIRRFRLGEAVNIPIKGKMIGADPLYVLMVQYVF